MESTEILRFLGNLRITCAPCVVPAYSGQLLSAMLDSRYKDALRRFSSNFGCVAALPYEPGPINLWDGVVDVSGASGPSLIIVRARL